MALDFGGWGKEWAVDAIAEIARQHSIANALIDFGHDVRALGRPSGRPAWQLGVEDPSQPGSHRGQLLIGHGLGVASSGDYLRCFHHEGRSFGHIIDPNTGEPAHHDGRQITVIGPNCFLAGLLATTAFTLGPKLGMDFVRKFHGTEALFVTSSARLQSPHLWQYIHD